MKTTAKKISPGRMRKPLLRTLLLLSVLCFCAKMPNVQAQTVRTSVSHGNLIYEGRRGSAALYAEDIHLLEEKISTIPEQCFDPACYARPLIYEAVNEADYADWYDSNTVFSCQGCEEPEELEAPDLFETGDAPEEPDTPDPPETSDAPEEPEAPELPDTGEEPEEPDTPDPSETGDAPEEPGTPDPPETGDEPEEPDTPDPPETEDAPEEPDTPDPPEAGDTPEEPDTPDPPEAGDTPEEAGTLNLPGTVQKEEFEYVLSNRFD